VAEAGLPGAGATSWGAVLAPAGTPAPAIARLAAAIREVLSQPATRNRMSAAGADPAFSTPEELAAFIRSENAKWGRVVRDARITVG
uniref:tripartite tricarboxylate transporter substrate-binding protein n=1 Tax=Falsiroseomonas oryzae TaxID=2766473 RepID=UPI0022EA394D